MANSGWEAVADNPRRVYFYVLNAVSPEGHRMAPVKGNGFILESGELELTMSARGRFVIEGGYYNDEVYNSWRVSDEYTAAQADQARLYTPVDGESEEDKRRRLGSRRGGTEQGAVAGVGRAGAHCHHASRSHGAKADH